MERAFPVAAQNSSGSNPGSGEVSSPGDDDIVLEVSLAMIGHLSPLAWSTWASLLCQLAHHQAWKLMVLCLDAHAALNFAADH